MGHRLLLEYEDVMSRLPLFARCPLTAGERRSLLESFLSVCEWVQVYYLWRPNLPDESDNHLLELAVAGGATMIVTNNDADFRAAELKFPALRIVRPAELMEELE